MSQQINITYYYHSGFSVSVEKTLLIFDYWLGEKQELPHENRITEEFLNRFEHVHVFISHEHPDHCDPEVLRWLSLPQVDYILAGDIPAQNVPVGAHGKWMDAGDVYYTADEMKVTAYPSTDLGVSYLVRIAGVTVFHAGDLNFWHWREESTVQEIAQAQADFRTAMEPLKGQHIDVAFFPVDPRQGQMYDAGAIYFILQVKPRILLPMHYWSRADLMDDFRRNNSSQDTVVMALTHYGEQMDLLFEDNGYISVTTADPQLVTPTATPVSNPTRDIDLTTLNELDPFSDSDLPVSMEQLQDGEE